MNVKLSETITDRRKAFAELLARFALAHPHRELSSVTVLEVAQWNLEQSR